MTTLKAEAFAKTNRSLLVRGERPDGYHEIETVFQSIDLTDELEVAPAPTIELECDDASLPAGPGNLVFRAAERLAAAYGVRAGARIRLKKRIPAGAGLGGGSSDAAIVLALLARLWEIDANLDSLSKVGSGIGSDVPFFFLGGAARGLGRGEILTPLRDEPARRLVLVVPPFPVATAAVYARWKAAGGSRERDGRNYFGSNDLASAVLETKPEMARYLETVAKSFPDCQISGSGSSIVAAVSEAAAFDLESVRNGLPEAKVYVLSTVAREEYRRRSALDAFDLPEEVREP